MRAALTVARRELAGFFHAPIAYVVGVVFLVIQGFSFWAVVRVLSDPRQPAESGAVLHTHFGGTFLFWAVLAAVVAMVAMRAVAEDRRQGIWEATLSCPVSLEAVLVGKWLGALGFYAALWAPTLLYLLVLGHYSPPGSAIDPGPVVAAYLGVLALGAGFLALGVAASAATDSQIIAGVVGFGLCLGALLVGELRELAPDAVASRPALAALVGAVDVRGHMGAFARGAVELGGLVFSLGLAAVGLAAAQVAGAIGRVSGRELRRRALALGLCAIIAALATALAARRPVTWDWTRADVHTLEGFTRRALAAIDEPVDVTVVRPAAEVFDGVYEEVGRLLDRMQREQPLLRVSRVDPLLEPDRVAALADEIGLAVRDVADGGAVVFELGERRRAVDLLAMAGFDRDDLGVGALSVFRAEEVFAEALSELAAREEIRVCASTGHGEMALEPAAGASWAAIGERLRRDGIELRSLSELSAESLEPCRALVVAGPTRPVSADAALAVDRYLRGGGALIAAARLRGDAGPMPATGLELVLAERGLALPAKVVVDPSAALAAPGAFAVVSGYGDHPIAAPFQDRRITVWQSPRAVAVSGGAAALVSASASARLVESAEAALVDGAGEPAASPALVAIGEEGRAIAIGSAESVSSSVVDRGLGAGDLLVARAVLWLVGRERDAAIGAKTPEHVRLVMTGGEIRATFALCVVVIPAVFAAIGALLWWWRRRE